MNEEGLLPCPFCGGEAEMRYDGGSSARVACLNRECFVQPEGSTCFKKADAARLWNTRASLQGVETTPCAIGGCDEAGYCYMGARGELERCPRQGSPTAPVQDDDAERVRELIDTLWTAWLEATTPLSFISMTGGLVNEHLEPNNLEEIKSLNDRHYDLQHELMRSGVFKIIDRIASRLSADHTGVPDGCGKAKIEVRSGHLDVEPDGSLVISNWYFEGGSEDPDEPIEARIIGFIIQFLQGKREEALARATPTIGIVLARGDQSPDVGGGRP